LLKVLGQAPTTEHDFLSVFHHIVPDLSRKDLYKGATGRVAVVGGSAEYCGAPYYAAMSFLRGGGELAHVFCAPDAAPAIKTFSPELIVHPGFCGVVDALHRMHAVVLGPGLGRGEDARAIVRDVVAAKVGGTQPDVPWPLVMDADALFFLASDRTMMESLRASGRTPSAPPVYLTPNAVELRRLCDQVGVADAPSLVDWFRSVDGNGAFVTVVAKGVEDLVVRAVDRTHCDTPAVVAVRTPGTRKRCGGQGDFLVGLTALNAGWAARVIAEQNIDVARLVSNLYVSAAVAACATTRRAAALTFKEYGRAMVASDMLQFVGRAFDQTVRRVEDVDGDGSS
jgi:ATP-dependent NAD(P)H-hydrate dehydratase